MGAISLQNEVRSDFVALNLYASRHTLGAMRPFAFSFKFRTPQSEIFIRMGQLFYG